MFKAVAFTLLSVIALSAAAQFPGGMTEGDMQKLMQGVQAMQACMGRIDMAALERLGEEGQRVEGEVKSLCSDGKRDQAQQQAMAFGMRIATDPALQTLQECGRDVQGMLPSIPYADLDPDGADGETATHICDL